MVHFFSWIAGLIYCVFVLLSHTSNNIVLVLFSIHRGFTCIAKGTRRGVCFHPFFVRGNPDDLSSHMKRSGDPSKIMQERNQRNLLSSMAGSSGNRQGTASANGNGPSLPKAMPPTGPPPPSRIVDNPGPFRPVSVVTTTTKSGNKRKSKDSTSPYKKRKNQSGGASSKRPPADTTSLPETTGMVGQQAAAAATTTTVAPSNASKLVETAAATTTATTSIYSTLFCTATAESSRRC